MDDKWQHCIEIPTGGSTDNAGNSVNLVSALSVYPWVGISLSALETDDGFYLSCNQRKTIFFFSADVLSEDSIMKWYKNAHSQKGKSVFLEQMKPFVEWLENAEEGKLDGWIDNLRGLCRVAMVRE